MRTGRTVDDARGAFLQADDRTGGQVRTTIDHSPKLLVHLVVLVGDVESFAVVSRNSRSLMACGAISRLRPCRRSAGDRLPGIARSQRARARYTRSKPLPPTMSPCAAR
jgi:hypothetical protein